MTEAGTKGAVGLARSKVLDLLPHGLPSIPSQKGTSVTSVLFISHCSE